MTKSPRMLIVPFVLASGLLDGCSSSPSTPSPPPPAGMVELTTNRPDGAMLVVNQCVDEEGNLFTCTRDLQMTFSVLLNRDVDRGIVWTDFYTTTGRLCAAASTRFVSLTAGTPVTLTASTVYLSLQGSATSPECGLPLQTTRMVARLFRDPSSPHQDLLTQEFSKAYTFVSP
jgi:hypothetical protein